MYNVYLSNGEVLVLDESVITSNELLLKGEIDSILYNKLVFDNEVCLLINASVKYIGIRLRSIKEINDYLYKKTSDSDIVNIVIDKLKSNGYLDDNRYANAFIKDKLNFTSWGDYKIINELNRLGVSSFDIENNMYLLDDDTLNERMKKIIDKDIRTNKKYSGVKLRNKVYNHLLTSGYSKNRVISIINCYDF